MIDINNLHNETVTEAVALSKKGLYGEASKKMLKFLNSSNDSITLSNSDMFCLGFIAGGGLKNCGGDSDCNCCYCCGGALTIGCAIGLWTAIESQTGCCSECCCTFYDTCICDGGKELWKICCCCYW